MKRAQILCISLCMHAFLQCASKEESSTPMRSLINSFLVEIEADPHLPSDYHKIRLFQTQEPSLRKLEKRINQYHNKLALTPTFISSITPAHYKEDEALTLQLKCALYIAERIKFDLHSAELYFASVNLEQDRSMTSYRHIDRPKLCIIGQLTQALHNQNQEEAQLILDQFLCDIGCVSYVDLPPYQQTQRRLHSMRNIIALLPKEKPRTIGLLYHDIFTCRFKKIMNLVTSEKKWHYLSPKVGAMMTTLHKYWQQTTPTAYQTAMAAYGLFNEIIATTF